MPIASRHGPTVLEVATQAMMTTCVDRPLGSTWPLNAFTFHRTTNVNRGKGGDLHVNDGRRTNRTQYIREKGTNREQF